MATDLTLVGSMRDNADDEIEFEVFNGFAYVIFTGGDECTGMSTRVVMQLDASKQEEFAQLFVASCHQAKADAEAAR